ncbi:AI-2E family transporter [Gottfriedia acidiceleris]|uniref:AI-2E family transporter n=1 Tax=Bacillaceae TaxID=186817 RepID=UPI000BEBA601|nr:MULTISPECIES: AI-2E family transporter [unclassified Bacillus (in: firmicutes)]PEC50028.1 AI-2E family transporter [Bacillus sp. AFS096315]PFM79300.1 AI-2E family transporter [Bacillus sp. AFS077874]
MEVKKFFQSSTFRRLAMMACIILVLILTRKIINLILLIFIFTYLMDRVHKFIINRVNKILPVNRLVVVYSLYIVIVAALVIGIYNYLPVITTQVVQLIVQIKTFYMNPPDEKIINYIVTAIKKVEISGYTEQGLDFLYKYASNISQWGIEVLIALVLSFFFLLEKPRIIAFTKKFENSKISLFYYEMAYFGERFSRSFGKVIEAQFLIALVNCILSVIALRFMGFPQLIGLGFLIFLLGLIPVAGMFISLIPLCTIAYTIGGMAHIMYVILMIFVLHALETYFLNPKLISAKTNLPVFYTFLILVFSERFFGVWGLIIGIPVFIFLLDVLGVTDHENKEIETTK